MELNEDGLSKLSSPSEVVDRIRSYLQNKRSKSFFVSDFRSKYHETFLKQVYPATNDQFNVLANEIADFIILLKSRFLYKKHMISIITACSVQLYECSLANDEFGGINKLKRKVKDRVNNRKKQKKSKKIINSRTEEKSDQLEDLNDSVNESGEQSISESSTHTYSLRKRS